MSISSAMKTEMQRPYFVSAFLIRIELADHIIRILDGAGEVSWGAEVFRGSDPLFGVMSVVDDLQEQVGTEAPGIRVKFLPESTFSMASISDPVQQGSPFNIYWTVIDQNNGTIIGEPYLVFGGELDAAEVDVDQTETSVTMDIASTWERLFMNGEGMRLNNSQHSHVWAERATQERGFEYVVAIQRQEPWGYDGPRPHIVADTNGGLPASISGSIGGGSNSGGGVTGGGEWYDSSHMYAY